MERRRFLFLAAEIGLTVGIGAGSGLLEEYADLPMGCDAQEGRTKNALASVVAGLIGYKLYGHSQIDMEVQKYCFLDTTVTGTTTPTSINTNITDLWFASVHFNATADNRGYITGEVDKSEFDWKIKQTSNDTYPIARFGPKFDATLKLYLRDGKIIGDYERPGLHFDWKLNGEYKENGEVWVDIDGPWNWGITLDGVIKDLTPKKDLKPKLPAEKQIE